MIICMRVDSAHVCTGAGGVLKVNPMPWSWSDSSCEPPDTCCEVNLSPVKEQFVLLTVQPSFQPRVTVLKLRISR